MSGWECPKCGRVFAPTVSECRPCNGAVTTAPTQPVYVPNPSPTVRPWPYPWQEVWCETVTVPCTSSGFKITGATLDAMRDSGQVSYTTQ